MHKDLKEFLKQKKLFFEKKLGRGFSSHIFLVKNKKGKYFVVKMEKDDSTRLNMAEKEAENLEKANTIGIGPKLIDTDFEKRIVLMEFIEGPRFSDWVFENPSETILTRFVKELQRQTKALDKIGLDHGQLAGRGRNILVRKGLPVIIDFEKASCNRKCHNFSVIESFLFKSPKGAIAAEIKKIIRR